MLIPKGYGQSTDVSAVTSLDDIASIPDRAYSCLIQVENHDIRWRDDGTDPSATVGMLLKAGDLYLYSGKLSAFKMIETASHATVNINYYS